MLKPNHLRTYLLSTLALLLIPAYGLAQTHSHNSLDASDGNPDDVVYVDAAGEVGIGTTSPAEKLHVYGRLRIDALNSGQYDLNLYGVNPKARVYATSGTAWLELRRAGTGNGAYLNFKTGGSTSYSMGMTNQPSSSNSNFKIAYGGIYNNSSPAFSINSSNQVGIGTTNAGRTLDVAGTTRTEVLEITGGSDLAEGFDVTGEGRIVPGMVVSIDPSEPGRLRIADQSYDKSVAGIVSGAGGVGTGMLMGQAGVAQADGRYPIALTGRVYALVDASSGAVQPGDLLTTSMTPGHAMKVADYTKAQGAVLGKAITPLAEGRGLVLVLVSLQ